MTKVHITSTL